MSPDERQKAILTALRTRRQVTAEHLACELGVNVRTIYRDIQTLTLSYPIEAIRGRHGGGFRLASWYHANARSLDIEQSQLLKHLAKTLSGEDRKIIQSILMKFKT